MPYPNYTRVRPYSSCVVFVKLKMEMTFIPKHMKIHTQKSKITFLDRLFNFLFLEKVRSVGNYHLWKTALPTNNKHCHASNFLFSATGVENR